MQSRDWLASSSAPLITRGAPHRSPEATGNTESDSPAAGAEITEAPHDTDYGSREFAFRDPEGNLWSFGTYRGEPRKDLA